MLTGLNIHNFRSIKDMRISTRPITVLYGANSSGKSSALYAPIVFKNIVSNPNQTMNVFFNMLFSNLGDYDHIVFDHNTELDISIYLDFNIDNLDITFGITLSTKESFFSIKVKNAFEEKLAISFPYTLNANRKISYKKNTEVINLNWNGITLQPTEDLTKTSESVIQAINSGISNLSNIDIVPLKRGFLKPIYAITPLTPFCISEDEVASLISGQGGYLEGRINHYFKQIFNCDFRTYSPPGSANFYLRSIGEKGFTSELVNEGFGMNQTVYMLAKIIKQNTQTIFIEEPEIHLHPTAQARLVDAFIEIVKDENKTIVLSTHSEHIVTTLLSRVSGGMIAPEDLSFYFVKKDKEKTTFKRQKIQSNGQVEGGLMPFMQTELDSLKSFLGVKSEKGDNS